MGKRHKTPEQALEWAEGLVDMLNKDVPGDRFALTGVDHVAGLVSIYLTCDDKPVALLTPDGFDTAEALIDAAVDEELEDGEDEDEEDDDQDGGDVVDRAVRGVREVVGKVIKRGESKVRGWSP